MAKEYKFFNKKFRDYGIIVEKRAKKGKYMIKFEKIQGLGNDFIIVEEKDIIDKNLSHLAKNICDRHFGIGADGLIVACSSESADAKMLFFNPDGTQAPMCGNGIRCFAKYVFDHKIVDKEVFKVETLAGIMQPSVYANNGKAEFVRVNLGYPDLEVDNIPVEWPEHIFIEQEIEIGDFKYMAYALNIGSPNLVVVVEDLGLVDVEKEGDLIAHSPYFPRGINVNFAKKVNEREIELMTWERGVGKTLGSGTGAAAAAYIGYKYLKMNAKINVHQIGGSVGIEVDELETIHMIGPAHLICEGNFYE